jgi:hypothetical protein
MIRFAEIAVFAAPNGPIGSETMSLKVSSRDVSISSGGFKTGRSGGGELIGQAGSIYPALPIFVA